MGMMKKKWLECCTCFLEQTCCGPLRCLPHQVCANPLPYELNISVSGTFPGGPFGGGGDCTCLDFTGRLTFYENGSDNPHTGGPNVWTTGFTLCGVSYRYSLGCVEGSLGWRLAFINGNGAGANLGNCLNSTVFHPDGILMVKSSCDLLALSGQFFTSGIGCCGPSHLIGLATLDVEIWEDP